MGRRKKKGKGERGEEGGEKGGKRGFSRSCLLGRWDAEKEATEPVYLTVLPAYPDEFSRQNSQSLSTRIMTVLHTVQFSRHLKEKG